MVECHSCGKLITEDEAYARKVLGGETFFFCCPMCLSAFQAGPLVRRMILQEFSDRRGAVQVEYLPALQVGGDYACIRSVGQDRLYAIVADVSGHGIAPSMVMSRVGGETERLVRVGEDIAVIGEALNTLMLSNFASEGLYLTLFAAEIDFFRQSLTYINCGHPAQLLWSQQDRRCVPLESQNLPVGLFKAAVFGRPHKRSVEARAGDKLMLYTDGFLELKLEDGSELGEAGMIKIFRDFVAAPSEEARRQRIEQIRASQRERLTDDLLFIWIDLKAN